MQCLATTEVVGSPATVAEGRVEGAVGLQPDEGEVAPAGPGDQDPTVAENEHLLAGVGRPTGDVDADPAVAAERGVQGAVRRVAGDQDVAVAAGPGDDDPSVGLRGDTVGAVGEPEAGHHRAVAVDCRVQVAGGGAPAR